MPIPSGNPKISSWQLFYDVYIISKKSKQSVDIRSTVRMECNECFKGSKSANAANVHSQKKRVKRNRSGRYYE